MIQTIDEQRLTGENSLFENSLDGIFRLSSEGKIVKANTALANMIGYTAGHELLGRPLIELLVRSKNQREFLVRQLENNMSIKNYELVIDRSNAEQIVISLNAYIVYDEHGELLYTEGTLRDVTEHHNAIKEVRESESRYRLISENVADLLAIVEMDGAIQFASYSFLNQLGYNPDTLRGQNLFSFVNPEDLPRYKKSVEDVISSIRHHSVEHRLKHMDQSWVYMDATMSPLINDDGMRILVVARNISERVKEEQERKRLAVELQVRNKELEQTLENIKTMQVQLVQSEKMASLGQLTAGIAHEINNPLAFVASNINRFSEYFEDVIKLLNEWETVGTKVDQNPEYAKAVSAIRALEDKVDLTFVKEDFSSLMKHTHEGAERIKRIVDMLRGFSHNANGMFGPTNIHDVLEESITLVWNELKYKVALQKQYSELPQVECNRSEIAQVIVNLLVNASHAIPERGTITLHTAVEQDRAVIDIIDNGTGISEANLKKIFDPFFTTKGVGKGTGLGLWICSTIIEKHKGALTVSSEVGKGTTFRISLPLKQQ